MLSRRMLAAILRGFIPVPGVQVLGFYKDEKLRILHGGAYHIYIYVYTYIHIHTHIYTHMHICILHAYIHTHIHPCVQYIGMYVCYGACLFD